MNQPPVNTCFFGNHFGSCMQVAFSEKNPLRSFYNQLFRLGVFNRQLNLSIFDKIKSNAIAVDIHRYSIRFRK